MRLSAALLLLPAFVLADEQKPLKEKAAAWFDKAKAYIPTAPAVPIADAGASAVASKKLERININNWERKLAPSPSGPQEWMILVSGKNDSCWGGCDGVNQAWNLSVPLLSALPSSPRLGSIDCEIEGVLCGAWGASIPSLWHFRVAQATKGATAQAVGQASGPSPLHILEVNSTTVTAQEIVKIFADKEYLEVNEYKGAFHPIDGWLRQYGLLKPFGYFMWAFGSTPSWLIMIGISFFSRQLMSRRMNTRMTTGPAAPAAR